MIKHEKLVRQMVEYHKSKNSKGNEEDGIRWWQLSLIGLGSIIGAGFFLGSGLAIELAGSSVIISYILSGLIAMVTFSALTEMTVNDPDPGSFRAYIEHAFGDRMGYMSGWMYWIAGVFCMASEVSALSVFTTYWFPYIPLWIFAVLYAGLSIGINLMGVKDFGKIESSFAVIKIAALVVFILFGVYLITGDRGMGTIAYPLEQHWFPRGFTPWWSSLIFTLYPFAGVAIVGIASNEVKDKKSIPKAIYTLIGSLMVLYIFSIFFILKLAPYKEIGTEESPFVTALSHFGFPYIDSIFNFIMICAAFSTMVAALFCVTNILVALSEDDNAPKKLRNKNKRGVALRALWLSGLGFCAAIILSFVLPSTVYEYMTSAAGIILLLNSCMIIASQIKKRKMYIDDQVHEQFRMKGAPFVSYMGIAGILFAIVGAGMQKTQRTSLFIAIGIIVIIYCSYSMTHKKP